MTTRRALWGLIVGSALLRVVWAASLGPGNDEAYHYLFTVHRDWSYFDHPPMLALIESLGPKPGPDREGRFSLLSLRFSGSHRPVRRLHLAHGCG